MARRCRACFSLLFSGLATLSTVRGDDPFQSTRLLTVGKHGQVVAGKVLSLGRLQLEFSAGALFPLTSADGVASGYIFAGKGRYTYRIEDRFDLETFARNCDLQAKNLGHSDRSIYDTFDRALLVLAQPQWSDLSSGPAAAFVPSDLEHWFDKRWRQIETEWNALSHRLAESRLNVEHDQVAYVEIEGDHAPVIYTLELQRGRYESFGVPWQPSGYDWRAFRSISDQPGPGWERKPKARWRVDKLSLDVNQRARHQGTVRAVLSIELLADGQRVLSFGLINNRDDAPTTTWTSTKNALNVRQVTDAAGRELPFSHRYDELLVDLGRAPAARTRVDLTVDIEGEFFTAKGGEKGDQVADLSRISWYPDPIGYGEANFSFDLHVRCPKASTPVSTGETQSLRVDGESIDYQAKSDAPVTSVDLLLGKYTSHIVDLGQGRKLNVHGYGSILPEMVELQAGVFAELFTTLEQMLGELPYREIDIVEDPVNWLFIQYGRATPGVILVSTPMFRPFVNSSHGTGSQRGGELLVAHELAHQWFGVLVRPATGYDNWLSESMAEYLAGMVAQRLRLDDRKAQRGRVIYGWTRAFGEWDGFAPWCKAWSIEAAPLLQGANGPEYRNCLLYQRGPRTIHMLRGWMGDQPFLEILKRFLASYKNGRVTSDDFGAALSQATGQDLKWYVDDWYRRPEKPPLRVTATLQTGDDGRPQIAAHAEQPIDRFAQLLVPLVTTSKDGKLGVKLFPINKPNCDALIPLDAPVAKVEVDPFKLNLIEYQKPKK